LALVIAAQTQAATLAANPNATTGQVDGLMTLINQAYNAFLGEAGQFTSVDQTDKALRTALYFTRAADALTMTQNYPVSVQNRLQITATRLSQARNLLPGGAVGPVPGDAAHAPGATNPPVIGSAVVVNAASFAPVLAPGTMALIYGDLNLSPLATQAGLSDQLTTATLPYELASASVTIGGRAAQVFYVSPGRINFCVPLGLPAGDAEVIVTSQEGYVSRGTVTIAPFMPGLFATESTSIGVVLNAATGNSGPLDVTTPETFGNDKRTRLQLFAAGFSAGAANTDSTNDIQLGDGVVLPNLAESVTVEARTSDGRVYQLPVEYAGTQGHLAGADQINCVLVPQLRGAGSVDLTIIVGGQRSNTVQIIVR
jgi:uncharacterized protein (TIGR03437 family)